MENRLYKKKYTKVTKKVTENDNSITDIEKEVLHNVELQNENDTSWTAIVRKSKPKTLSTERTINVVTSEQVQDKEKEKELEEKYAQMKIWREAKNTIANEYLKLLCSYTKQEILNKIIKTQHIIDKKTNKPYNYVTLSCRAYNTNQEPVDILTENNLKFVLNQFFSDDHFIKQIKKYYENMGYNVGFKRRKFDENLYYTYTAIKIYYV